MIEYGIMLYYCLTGVKIDGYDVIYPEATAPVSKERSSHTENPTGTWLMEQKLYRLVEDGNLDFRSEMTRLTAGASPADLGSGDAMRHYKNLQIIFASGCARAAIRGGLSPEVSYDLSDKYIMDIEKAGSVAELLKINETMQEDYIMRVYRAKQQGNTPQIRQACDYIQTHIEEKLDLDTVSSAIGYSVSWLSGKFRKETGKTIGHYIAEQKAERAKLLLRADNRPVQDIAEELSFKTASHFSATFRRYTGMTPNEYRKKAGIEKS